MVMLPPTKGFTVNGSDEQEYVDRITDFLKFCKKFKVLFKFAWICFQIHRRFWPCVKQITFQAAMQTSIEASPAERVQQFWSVQERLQHFLCSFFCIFVRHLPGS